MTATAGYQGGRARRLKALVFATETHCHLCGQHVDQTLHHNHEMARTVDHLVPRSKGGDPYARSNARLAHRRCNTERGVGPVVRDNPRSVTW